MSVHDNLVIDMCGVNSDVLTLNLRNLDSSVLTEDERTRLTTMLAEDFWARLGEVNRRDAEAWAQVRSKEDWERFRNERIKALRQSLGKFPSRPTDLHVQVTRKIKGEDFLIENLVFESRPGILVTANLYLPDPLRQKMPGIIVCHSHHNPKTQDELQDMGMIWARQGATVLIMDMLGHGERRQHPFGAITRVTYQLSEDYYSRYFLGMQLQLIGESLIGWMVWDLMCGVELLLSHPQIDPEKIILIGSVAGGGDPAAVCAALDSHVACVVPFNFGKPHQVPKPFWHVFGKSPESAGIIFNYAGDCGDWESTRSLRLSARDGFLPWVIVASVAPRYLIYAHEFFWHIENDPVWERLQKIFNFYGKIANLEFIPGGAECNNVGPVHRRQIYHILYRWFGIPIPEEEGPVHKQQMYHILRRWFGISVDEREHQQRLPTEELNCLTEEIKMKVKPKMVHELAADIGAILTSEARKCLANLSPPDRQNKLRRDWARLLGDIEVKSDPKVEFRDEKCVDDITVERLVLEVEHGIIIPTLLLLPTRHEMQGESIPVILGIAQEGKERFLKERAPEIANLLRQDIAICLPDLRGTGETRFSYTQGRNSEETRISSIYLMLGQTLLGSRLRDLLAVLRYLKKRVDVNSKNMALWGESFAPTNPPYLCDLPQSSDKQPYHAEPLGALLALFGALFEENIKAIVARRGLVSFASMLSSPFCYVPHSILVPEALTVGDLCDVAAALAPRPLRLEGMIDGRNCPVEDSELKQWFKPTLESYAAYPDKLQITSSISDDVSMWLAKSVKGY